MENITEEELKRITALLLREGMASKKCRAYSNTLTDVDLAEKLEAAALSHEERFFRLLSIMEGAEK